MSQLPLAAPSAVPSPPRPITAAARWRSWAEMPVRIWWVLAITLAVVIVYFTVNQILAGADERALVLHGIPVDGVVQQVEKTTDPDASFHRGEALAVKVRYTLPNEQTQRIAGGMLSALDDPNAVIRPGDHLPLRVDPNDPNRWTDRTRPRSWFVELSVVTVLLPLLLLIVLIAFLQRARILRIWRDGDIAEASVVEVRQTALAPLSRQVRFTLVDGSVPTVCSVLIPTRAGVPARGETISLVMARGVPQRAILPTLYV